MIALSPMIAWRGRRLASGMADSLKRSTTVPMAARLRKGSLTRLPTCTRPAIDAGMR